MHKLKQNNLWSFLLKTTISYTGNTLIIFIDHNILLLLLFDTSVIQHNEHIFNTDKISDNTLRN